MNLVTLAAGVLALLGSALIGGVLFAFSSFIMQALAGVPSYVGMADIRVEIWMGSLLSLVMAVFLIWYSKHAESKGWIS